ncbi:Archaeal 2-phospho-L-lactate transferase/Bacterial gluconeogenesis factor, CofD/UPF0052 family [Geosmithia morbida]|uniref:Archaeal 2-phospho-L-lactate transferase/Bacterial gluconeogenesis factor, CofD/UPF0052 family n=1 Tax=Geosmithia morbida TaxID=1094350 RepID=A0A9P4YPI1_9HYPO|nr:Archaeal 2-phospho-L-lactate transferase/Bacterial gluconeogenesis factor, CofD/UPF0052 family [Geosmithia morbida]KAF4119246.1 Archaeal 2-phospho-L-lactate transferase/Bacterial gluconeogenesis factor, CofD/UPF0052 family [Geosmithia morbida]
MPRSTSRNGLLAPADPSAADAPTSSTASQLPSSGGRRAVSPSPGSRGGGIVVFSGGSASNSLVDVFEHVRDANACTLSYVIPISDNGGSSSEIIRVFGGPGIGDVRSRLLRLTPDHAGPETKAVGHLLNHRLPRSAAAARVEWFEILEATHPLWEGISSPKRELIRSYLNSFNLEAVKRMRPTSRFDFSGSSVGNLFLTGARLFTGSFEAAVYLLGTICGVPDDRVRVLPAINTNFAHHIAAGLADGSVIVGQNDISHPSQPTRAVPGTGISAGAAGAQTPEDAEEHDEVEDANLPGSLPALRRPAMAFSKTGEEDLASRIERIWYINPYGQEIRIPASPRVIDSVRGAAAVVYSIGSLFTSLVPSLVLKGVGDAIAGPSVGSKILILNGTTDRETGPSDAPLTGLDFVDAIAGACAYSRGTPRPRPEEYCRYVTHVVYLDGPGAPKVDRHRLSQVGIDAIRVYGPSGGRYDVKALQQALESIIGRKDSRPDRSRRNTLVG